MSETLTKLILDCETGTETIVPLTPEEIAAHEARQAEWETMMATRQEEETAKAAIKESAKAKLVAGEPLTEEEAAAIVL
jgi:hypothetical protein